MICPTETARDEILVGYCAGTLDTDRAAEFIRHLQGCEACRRAVEAQSEVWRALDAWTPAEVSPDFDARLYARIAREDVAPPWKRWLRWKPAIPLAAACAAMAAGLLIHTPHVPNASPKIGADKVDIEQVESTLADLDMLTPASM